MSKTCHLILFMAMTRTVTRNFKITNSTEGTCPCIFGPILLKIFPTAKCYLSAIMVYVDAMRSVTRKFRALNVFLHSNVWNSQLLLFLFISPCCKQRVFSPYNEQVIHLKSTSPISSNKNDLCVLDGHFNLLQHCLIHNVSDT